MWCIISILAVLIIGVPLIALCIVKSGDIAYEDDVFDFDPQEEA